MNRAIIKSILVLVSLIICVSLYGCTPKVERENTSRSTQKQAVNKKFQKQLLEDIKQVSPEQDPGLWEEHSKEETLLTSSNGVSKLLGDGTNKIVGYKTYKVPDTWMIDDSHTKDKEQDAVWKLSGKKGWRSYVECYMLPTYVGDIADLTGRRADKTEIADILEKDGLKFSEKDMVTIGETKWHVGLNVSSSNNIVRVTFYYVEPDKGSFNESIQVVHLLAPLNKLKANKENREQFLKDISQTKTMITTFSETKEKEVPAFTDSDRN